MSDSVRPYRRQPTRLPCPWDSPGKNTGVGCHFLLWSATKLLRQISEPEIWELCRTEVSRLVHRPNPALFSWPWAMNEFCIFFNGYISWLYKYPWNSFDFTSLLAKPIYYRWSLKKKLIDPWCRREKDSIRDRIWGVDIYIMDFEVVYNRCTMWHPLCPLGNLCYVCTVSPLHVNKTHSNSMSVSPIC